MALKEYSIDDGAYGVRTFQWDTDERPLPPRAVLVGPATTQPATGFRVTDQVDQDEPPALIEDPIEKAKRPANKARKVDNK